ncbi:MAG: anti-sigma factor family protein [Chlorobiota bacterium]
MEMKDYNMTDSEKLAMLLDGETEGLDTTEVLSALADSPELQQEFLDTMRMRRMMSGQLETPPDRLRRGVLAGIGLGGSGLWYYLQNTGFAAASAFMASKVGVAIAAATIGIFSTLFFMDFDNADNPNIQNKEANSQFAALASAEPVEMKVPFVSSKNMTEKEIVAEKSSAVTNNRSNSSSALLVNDSNDNQLANSNLNNRNRSLFISESPINNLGETENYTIISEKSDYHTENYSNRDFDNSYDNGSNSGFIVNSSKRLSYDYNSDRALLFNLQAKGISNSSLSEPNMSVVESPTINNIGIALMYSVNEDFELGLEFGQEFFVNKVRVSTFDTDETMLENQLTFWGGLKANYTFSELNIITENLKPMTSLLIGGTNRGWVTKASAGLVYDVSNKISMFAGPEWTTGIYNFNSNLLSTHKFGMIYGMSLRF